MIDNRSDNDRDSFKKIEAILFISGRFLSIQELISISDFNPIIIKEVLAEIKSDYERRNSAIRIVEKNGLWKMDVVPEYSTVVNRLAAGSSEFSKAEQGTLALVAFKQPIKQSVVIKIRGNKAYDHIKKFYGLDLIRKKKTGHTYELSLSEEFYDYFNLSDNELKRKEGTS